MEHIEKQNDSGNAEKAGSGEFFMFSCCGAITNPAKDDIKAAAKSPTVMLPMAPAAPCCPVAEDGTLSPPRPDQPFVCGMHRGPWGAVPQVSSALKRVDRWGTVKARWGVGRMDYAVDPGLYALGSPNGLSPVLVTANYKMSFDRLREDLPGRDAWILILDTKGINVWCAAGKGTFGTEELVRRISASDLQNIVTHRHVILPQLGAPGVAAHTVRRLSGFQVHYGPILAKDLPAYLDAGMKATPAMRAKSFNLAERAALIPIELIEAMKAMLVIIPVMMLITALLGRDSIVQNVAKEGLFAAIAMLGAVMAGAVLNPLLLPCLPGRAFSTKGLTIGLLMAVVLLSVRGIDTFAWQSILGILAWMLIICAVSAYLAMNFTGASTFTSLSGVKREMRWALPLEGGMGLAGLVCWIISLTVR